MDPVLALAILSFGTFIGVCITGMIYVSAIRPGILGDDVEEPSPPRYEPSSTSLRAIRERHQGESGGQSLDALQSTLEEMAELINDGQAKNSRQLDEYLLKIKEISERISNQDRSIDDMSMYLTAELGSQDEALRTIISQIDTQTGIMANTNTILEDLESTGAIAGLARLLSDLGEQVNTMADNLIGQEDLVREVHAQIAPAHAGETLYGMMGKQGAQLNELAGQLRAFDTRLATGQPGSPDEYETLKSELDGLGSTLAQLNSQLIAQESSIRELVEQSQAEERFGELNAHLSGQDEKIDQLVARLTAEDEAQEDPAFGQIQERFGEITSKLSGQDEKIDRLVARFLEEDDAQPEDTTLSDINEFLRDQAQRIEQLDARISEQSEALSKASQVSTEHQSTLASISENLSELVPDIDAISKRKTRVIKAPQRLTDIKGIGPVYAGLLHEAGIETFAQLAALTPDELLNLIDVPSWRRIPAESWIEQATLFASQSEKVEKNR